MKALLARGMPSALVLGALALGGLPDSGLQAQSTTPPSQEGTWFIAGGDVVGPDGQLREGTDVLVRDGRIEAVGAGLRAPPGAEEIDARGLRVYPGYLDSATSLGLAEMASESDDRRELGSHTPELRSHVAVNAHSVGIPLARVNGITAAITGPAGGVIPGPLSLIQLDGWTWEEMTLDAVAGMPVNFPTFQVGPRTSDGERDAARARFEAEVAELERYFLRAREYAEGASGGAGPGGAELALEAMAPVVRGEVPAVIRAESREEILAALDFADALGLRLVLEGGREAWKVADTLAERGVPVVLASILRRPGFGEPIDAVFSQPAVLHRAGVTFALSTGSVSGVRNLPYHAGMATAYGLPPEAALRAITLTPAEIWGVEDELGSIEEGKRANLFLAEGDALDVRTRVVEVFVDGRRSSMDHRHRQLERIYSERPPR